MRENLRSFHPVNNYSMIGLMTIDHRTLQDVTKIHKKITAACVDEMYM